MHGDKITDTGAGHPVDKIIEHPLPSSCPSAGEDHMAADVAHPMVVRMLGSVDLRLRMLVLHALLERVLCCQPAKRAIKAGLSSSCVVIGAVQPHPQVAPLFRDQQVSHRRGMALDLPELGVPISAGDVPPDRPPDIVGCAHEQGVRPVQPAEIVQSTPTVSVWFITH
jgi:hypothetical protein